MQICEFIGTVTQVNNVAHGLLVYIIGQSYNVKIQSILDSYKDEDIGVL